MKKQNSLFFPAMADISVAHVYAATHADRGLSAAYATSSAAISMHRLRKSHVTEKSHTYTDSIYTYNLCNIFCPASEIEIISGST